MDYISLRFYLLLAVVLIIYYMLPLKRRWWALLLGSIAFMGLQTRPPAVAVFIYVIVSSYAMGIMMHKDNTKFMGGESQQIVCAVNSAHTLPSAAR